MSGRRSSTSGLAPANFNARFDDLVDENVAVLAADSIDLILRELRPERSALLELLRSLGPEEWEHATECPLYSVKGVAIHILGDDLSLLSRQRDAAENGLIPLAAELPGVDFRSLLDTFNNRWVSTARFLSTELAVEL